VKLTVSTPDLADAHPQQVQALELALNNYGGVSAFYGAVVTVKCHEDNSLVKELVGTPGAGRVIVVDGGGSLRNALLGDMLAEAAASNGWAGLVINGAIRDVDQIAVTELGVQALGCTPLKTEKLGVGQREVPVKIGGVVIAPGDWLYADNNGVLIAAESLLDDAS
jgi:regulator of ribonuclease activity A